MASLLSNGVFQELILLCKPVDVFSFAIRYHADENSSTIPVETAHSIHSLPFIFINHNEFRSTACTIFCSYTARNTSRLIGDTIVLDSTVTLEIMNAMQLGSIWFEIEAIKTAVEDLVRPFKRIDFNLFISILRFPIAAYHLAFWLRDELAEFNYMQWRREFLEKGGSQESSGNPDSKQRVNRNTSKGRGINRFSDKVLPSAVVDLTQFKNFTNRVRPTDGGGSQLETLGRRESRWDSSSSTSSLISCVAGISYNQPWRDHDSKIWVKILTVVLEEYSENQDVADSNPGHISVEDMSNEFISKFLGLKGGKAAT